jgi:hypothetical protein
MEAKENIPSRIWESIKDDKSFGIISSFKMELSEIENNNRHIELKKLVCEKGFGFMEMRRGFTTEKGSFVKERLLFIRNTKKNEVLDLGKLFDQFSVVYKDKLEFLEIKTDVFSGALTDFEKMGWNETLEFDSEFVKEFFLKIAKDACRDLGLLKGGKDFCLFEVKPISFNERAYGGKKSGVDEFLIGLV